MVGAGGHAKVLHALALAAGHSIVGVCDPQLAQQGQSHWRGVPVLGGDDALEQFDPATVGLINGIGQLVGSRVRQDIYTRLRSMGFSFPLLVHPAAWVASTARLAQGVQVMAGAVVQPDCSIGENSVVNTSASIDHDCVIGEHVHIAPGATLCGGVRISDGAFIAAGATIIQGVTVGVSVVVGAGATVTRDLDVDQVLLGPRSWLKDTATKQESDD
jgi:UDP-perosamine 4-acetyltransferase